MDSDRQTFTGAFERTGIKSGYMGPLQTVLLKNLKGTNGKIVADHLWFNLTAGFDKLSLKKGDLVQFDARVSEYLKCYQGNRDDIFDKPVSIDYKLSYPSKVSIISNSPIIFSS